MYEMYDLDEQRVRTYDVAIGGLDVGLCGNPEVAVKLLTLARKYPRFNQQVLGHRIMGVEAVVKLDLTEVNRANILRQLPWITPGGGNVNIAVVLGEDLYGHAATLTLHPVDMGSDKSEDVHFFAAVHTGGLVLKGDGEAEGVIPLELTCYPARAYLPQLILGRIGNVAT